MKTKTLLPLIIFLALAALIAPAGAWPSYGKSSYYLPRGYEVSAVIETPEPPFWPGVVDSGVVGLSDGKEDIIVYAHTINPVEPFGKITVELIVSKIVTTEIGWKEERVINRVIIETFDKIADVFVKQKISVKIIHTKSGQVRIYYKTEKLENYKTLATLVSTTQKYVVLASGVELHAPQPIVEINIGGSEESAGSITVNKYLAWFLLGVGAIAVIITVLVLVLAKKR